jgi:putative zinc finger/helix-turn-helix YgiT family protein
MKKIQNKIKCPICNEGLLEKIASDYSTFVKDGAREIRILVKNLQRDKCPKCNEEFLPQEALDRIEIEKYQKLELLTPTELKMIREKLSFTQEEMSDLLGVGKKSYFRWENGLSIQNKSIDKYIRLVSESPDNVLLLKKLIGQEGHRFNKEKVATYFESIRSIDSEETAEEELVAQAGYKAEVSDEIKKKVQEVIKKYLEEQKNG